MEGDEIFLPIEALIFDLKKQLGEKDALLKKAKEDKDFICSSYRSALVDASKAYRKTKELHTTVSEKDKIIKDRDITIEKLQKTDALKNICEGNKALKRTVDNNDRVIAKKDVIISNIKQILADKDTTIAQKILLPSSAQPNSGPVFGSLEVLELVGGLTQGTKAHSLDQYLPILTCRRGKTPTRSQGGAAGCRGKSLIRMSLNTCPVNLQTELFKKPLYEIGLKIRARKLELDFAARTGSTAKDNILKPGNFAAHSADAIADAHMIRKFDPIVEIGTESGNPTSSRCPRLREQFLLNYIVSPELVLKSSKPRSPQDPGFSYLVYLINWYENLRLWNLEGIVGNAYGMLRKRIKGLVDRISTLEEFVNDDDFEEDEEVMKEFGGLQRIMSKLKAAHRSFRANLSLSRKRSKKS
ncbi:hypothetical protein BPAE_0005g00090 [Botrytis paeoniae]|uniref:Uncharacterized protein n=1 Tax=Botrytis paeoniae TaxID=278948 RepID=A0A4Z1G099_9HELO|nr:hypothetical protein BPAE_0005g00090 [Botrytis paeoniae]